MESRIGIDMFTISRIIILALSLMVIVGCNSSEPELVPVTGTVLLDGKPLPHAEVRYIPILKNSRPETNAIGITDENGSFTMTTNGQPGAVVAEMRVTVTEGPLPEGSREPTPEAKRLLDQHNRSLKNRPIPERYRNLVESSLKVTITPENNVHTLKLTR